MKSIVTVITLLWCNIGQHNARFVYQYENIRDQLIHGEHLFSVGAKLHLSDDEKRANEVLMYWKNQEVDQSFNNPRYNNFSKHFFAYKDDIWKSKVYQIIKKMPKGAALHVHSSMMLDPDTLMSFTYEDHLYTCQEPGYVIYRFHEKIPNKRCSSKWNLLSDLRKSAGNVTQFDAELRKYFTLYTKNVEEQNADINKVWDKFEHIHNSIKGLIGYRPVREKYIYAMLKKFYEDNIIYIEIRSGLQKLYELDGSEREQVYLARLYKQITNKFIKQHPDFVGIKLILTSFRRKDISEIENAMDVARKVKKEMPHLFAGYDLIGQEDTGKPLTYYLPALRANENELTYYLHGGETNFYGTTTDENVFDAVYLGSKRIGHAYALTKHPHLMKEVLQRDIAIEVNVVSNEVLCLVRDVRNHPLATFLAFGLPVVLSSDDPGVWEADPLSHDFYIAFVGVASKHSDLRLLKQLALNSIKYSALNDTEKSKAYRIFYMKWNSFIKELNHSIQINYF